MMFYDHLVKPLDTFTPCIAQRRISLPMGGLSPARQAQLRILTNGTCCITVDCGRCVTCRMKRAHEWEGRIAWEYSNAINGFMVTPTYDWAHVPFIRVDVDRYKMTLRKSHLVNFMDRLRKAVKRAQAAWLIELNKPCRSAFGFMVSRGLLSVPRFIYYATSEYGGVTHRPHYHAILLNVPSSIISKLMRKDIVWRNVGGKPVRVWDNIWGKGSVDVRPIKDGGIAYVTKYLTDVGGMSDYAAKHGKTRPFAIMSRGIGLSYVLRNADHLIRGRQTDTFRCRGSRYPFPRYFRKKMAIPFLEALHRVRKNRKEMEGKREAAFDSYAKSYGVDRSDIAALYETHRNVIRNRSDNILKRAKKLLV